MLEFITEHKNLMWLISVALFTAFMLFSIRFSFIKLIRRAERRDSIHLSTIKVMQRILSLFFIVLGLGLASYTFFEKEMYEAINKNMQRIIWIAFVLLATLVSVALTQNYFQRRIDESFKSDQQDPTTYKFMNYFSTFFIYLIGLSLASFAIPQLQFLAQSAMTGAGVLALVVGVASQEAISNLVGGAFIVMFKPFRIGHTVQIGSGIKGVVEDLTLRHTVIRDFQNRRVIIPNSVINKEYVTNFNLGDPKVCEWLEVGISYDSDVDKAISIIEQQATQHPLYINNLTAAEKKAGKHPVDVRVIAWGDSSVNLRAYIWAKNSDDGVLLRHQLLKTVKAEFEKSSIEIPYPHQVMIYKKEAVHPLQ